MGVGIPFNKEFMTFQELEEMGKKLASWEPNLQVTVLDYRPEFRAQHIERPPIHVMKNIKEILNKTGLSNVICQSIYGHIK